MVAPTEEEDMEAGSTATEATEPAGTATWTWTSHEPYRAVQMTENPEAVGTSGDRLETGRMEGGTNAAMTGAPTTVTRTPEVAAIAAWSPEDG